MRLPTRRKRVIAVAITLTDFPITPMCNHIATLVLGNLASTFLCLTLGIVPRGIAAVPLTQYRPRSIITLHNMLVGHNRLQCQGKVTQTPYMVIF